jgi:hypothetical protein
MEFGPGYARYALRYWMLDPQPDDPTDSRGASARASPHCSVRECSWQCRDSRCTSPRRTRPIGSQVRQHEIEKRIVDLRKVELFAGLQEEELRTVSEHLIFAPFASGDVIFRQGDAAHWLYLLTGGEAEVWIDFPDQPRKLFRTILAGSTFGERGVLIGEPRRDTVVARTDVVCYRLGRATLEEILHSRPEIAEAIAAILTRREREMDDFMRQFVDAPATESPPQRHMLEKIRSFLGL